MYTKLRKRGLAPATIRQIHAILRASLNQAERWGLIQRNVAKLASAPAQPQREQHPPSIAEVRLLMASAIAPGSRQSRNTAMSESDHPNVRARRSRASIAVPPAWR